MLLSVNTKAGIVEHAVAHLQDITGKQALVHGDIQDDFRGVIQLFDLRLDAVQIFFAELMGAAQAGLDDAVVRKKFTTEFSCHCLHLNAFRGVRAISKFD